MLNKYCVASVTGFFRSIALSQPGNSLQDTLRLLTLWFDYGQWPDVYEALTDGVKTVQIDNWLQVSADRRRQDRADRQLASGKR